VPARFGPGNRTFPPLARGLAVLALGLGALTACGGDSGSGSASGATTESEQSSSSAASSSSAGGGAAQTLTATETNFAIALDNTDLTAGTYDITVENNGSATHNLTVEENGTTEAASDSIGPGEKTTLTVDLDAGEYVFYCAIGNHRAMGMEMTVQVTG
jgi:plastocyanin